MWKEYIDYNPDLENNITVLLGRGCPYSCTYCCNHALKKITDGNYVRFRSPRKIIEEIQLVHEEYPLENRLYLEVESFNVNNEWAIEVCNEIEKYNGSRDIPLSFGLNIRITPNANFDILFEACRRANILDLNIGIESGSERVRKDILKRNYSNFDVINTINSVKKYGLSYNFFIMIGIPGETIEDFEETIKICRIYQPKKIFLSIFYPYPGTDLYKLCEKMNFLQDKIDINIEERKQATLKLPDFNKIQIQRSYIWFNYNVYKGYKSKINLIKEVIEKFLRFNSFFNLILTKYFHSHLIIKLKKSFKWNK